MITQEQLQTELNAIRWTGRTYHLQEKVILDQRIPLLIQGCYLHGWHPYAPQYCERRLATIEVTNYSTPAIEVHGPHAGLIGHAIWYPEQSKYIPNFYPVTISAPPREGDKTLNPNVSLKHISFFGAMSFISLTGGGQHVVEDIRGQVLGSGYGILLDGAADVIRLKDISLWPSWSASSIKYGYWNPPITGNTRGIIVKRADWPIFSDIFIYGLHVAIQLHGPGGDPQISNVAIDASSVGLDIYDLGYQGMQIDNFRIAGNQIHGAWKCYPIIGRSTIKKTIQISNYHADGALNPIVWNTSPQYLQIANKHTFSG